MVHSRTTLTALLLGCLVLGSACTTTSPADYTETIKKTEISFDMVWVAEGEFWMGRHEVTWDQYLVYCDWEETGAVPPGADVVSKPSKPLPDVAPFDRDWGTGDRPVVGMSWNAAKKFCRWLSINTGREYRLPTETEWELACGPVPAPLAEHAWFKDNTSEMTEEVGKKKPNENGLHDMLGNLWEYCQNPWSSSEPERAVLRGGSWLDPADQLTPKARLGYDDDWDLIDPNVPPGVWWSPDGEHLGMRVLRVK